MTGDGAYDGQAVYDEVAKRHPEAAVIIPPRSTAVSSETASTQRDKHLETIARHGRIGWQRSSGYSRRSLVETAMYRYKTISMGVPAQIRYKTIPLVYQSVANLLNWVSMTVRL